MTILFPQEAMDTLCPMHLFLDRNGRIQRSGPTLRKLGEKVSLVGRGFLDVFEIRKPRAVQTATELRELAGEKLRLKLRTGPHTSFKGVLVMAQDPPDHMIVNLSFGISVLDGVREFSLTNADFAPTDLALELMYLVEAKTAAMEATSKLNARLRGAKIAAEEKASTDTLTGLNNRRALDAALHDLLKSNVSFAVMQIDLDYFKSVNDTLGHAAGDHVLQTVARIMLDETRSDDLVARVGGDEFTVILHDVKSKAVLERIGRRIINRLEEPIPFEDTMCKISASIGTVWVHLEDDYTMSNLLSDADLALYASKHAGRATQTLFHPGLKSKPDPQAAPPGRATSRDKPGV